MAFTDPIADMLTRIRNAQMARHETVRAPYSRIKFDIAKIMEKEGYIGEVSVEEVPTAPFKEIVMKLKYEGRAPVIRELKRISTPGHRVYAKAKELPHVYAGIGVAIISTSNGLMTNKDARKRSLGGEVLCSIF